MLPHASPHVCSSARSARRLTSMYPSRARPHAQLTLFCPVQEFDRGFAPRGFCPVLAGFAVYEPERPAAFGVFGSLAGGMLGQAPVEITGDTGVQGLVSAFEHIDNPEHSAFFIAHTAP